MGSSIHPSILQRSLPQHILLPSESSIPRGSSYFSERNGKPLLKTWKKEQSEQHDQYNVTSKDFAFIDLIKKWMNVGCISLSKTHMRLSLCSLKHVIKTIIKKQLSNLISKFNPTVLWLKIKCKEQSIVLELSSQHNFLYVALKLYESDLMRLLFGWIKTWFVLWGES